MFNRVSHERKKFLFKYFFMFKNILLIDKKNAIIIIILDIFSSILNPLILFVNSLLIDQTIISITNRIYKNIIYIMIIFVMLNGLKFIILYFINISRKKMQHKIDLTLCSELIDVLKEIDILEIQSEGHNNTLNMAKEITNGFSIMHIIHNLSSIVGVVISLISYLSIIGFNYGIIILCISIICQVLLALKDIKFLKEKEIIKESNVSDKRLAEYYYSLVYDVITSKEIQLYELKEHILEKWKNLYSKVLKEEYKVNKMTRYKSLLYSILSTILTFTIIFVMFFINTDKFTAGNLILIIGALDGIQSAITSIINFIPTNIEIYNKYSRYKTYIDMYKKDNIKDNFDNINYKNFDINIKNVSFLYPNCNRKVLKNINLCIKHGEKIAIVGANGAGKTTLINLILGLYTPTEGCVLIDKANIIDLYGKLNYPISYVSQNSINFEGLTLNENINLSDVKSDNLIEKKY